MSNLVPAGATMGPPPDYSKESMGPKAGQASSLSWTGGNISYTPTSLVKPTENAQVAAAAAPASTASSGWSGTPYMSKGGNPIVSKTVVVKKGKGAGKSRTIYAEWISATGKYKRISLQEITSGKKPKRSAARCAPRRSISKSSGGKKKTEVQKARAKFMRTESALGRKRDRKLRAPLVTKARDYDPQTTDMKGVDYPRKKRR